MQYLNTERLLTDELTHEYSLQTDDEAEDGFYVPGMQHTFALTAHETLPAIKGFIVATSPVDEDHCGAGIFSSNGRRFRQVPGCKHVIQNRRSFQTRDVSFRWTAPQCGCVKIRATVLTESERFSVDDDDIEYGALTRILCPDEDDEEL